MSLFVAVCILGTFATIIHRFIRKNADSAHALAKGCQQPRTYPHIDRLWGLDFLFKTLKLVSEAKIIPAAAVYHKEYGTTFRVKSLNKSIFYTIDSENLKAVYDKNSGDWGVGPQRLKAMQPFCGIGFITADGKPWEHSNAMLRQSLTSQNVEDLTTFNNAVEDFLNYVSADGRTVDLSPLLDEFFLDLGFHFLVGERLITMPSPDPYNSPSVREFLEAFHASMFWAGTRVFFRGLGHAFSSALWRKKLGIVHHFIDHYVHVAIQKRNDREKSARSVCNESQDSQQSQTLVSSLVEQTNDVESIRWQVIQTMLAMQDTCSTLTSNVLFLLSRNPSIWGRLREEVGHLDIDNISATELSEIPLLQNILHEALRLYPVLVQYGRTALNNTILPRGGGPDGSAPLFIRAGSIMISSLYALHRVPGVFGKDIEVFNPDRWNTINVKPCEYMPFGFGQRRCVGQHKAFLEVSYLIAKTAKRFTRIESRDGKEWVADWRLIVRNLHGCKVALFTE